MPKLDPDEGSAHREAWAELLDNLILGVTHQISNRVATLAGVSDILACDPSVPPILRALSQEVPRLAESIRLLRLLAVPANEAEEALEAHRLVADGVALARLSPAAADVDYTIRGAEGLPPVLARPVTLTHRILMVLAAAAADRGNTGVVTVELSVDGPDVTVAAGSHRVRVRLLTAARAARG